MLAGGLVIVPRTMHSRVTLAFASQSCLALLAGVLLLAVPSAASATFSGRNGRLLMWNDSQSVTAPPAARLAECDYPSELWSIRPDGTHLAPLGRGDTGIFSPSGSSLAINYQGDPCYGVYDGRSGTDPSAGLFLSRADGSQRRRIMGEALVGWLPNGRLIVARKGGQLIDALTGRPFMTIPGVLNHEVSMSCSGRVAVVREHEIDVFTRQFIKARGKIRVRTVERRVAGSPYDLSKSTQSPAWSLDGRLLLFARPESAALDPPFDLWTVGPARQGLHQVTIAASTPQGIPQDTDASWSPDGHRIVFDRYQLPPPDDYGDVDVTVTLIVMNTDGSAPRIVAQSLGADQQVLWSPDSSSIAVETPDYTVKIVNPTTSRARTIPYVPEGLVDWQALPSGRSVRCADHGTAPFNPKP
ncbi:MAG: hypothetical protein ACXVH3_32145 [Solirubrobacteraceae bacterium]